MSTKKKASKKPASKKAKGETVVQGYFEGVEPFRDKELDKQCQKLINARKAISEARDEEADIHAVLKDKMHAAKISQYEYDGKVFVCNLTEKVVYKNQKKDKPARAAAEKKGLNPDGPGPDVVDLDEPEGEEKPEFVDAVSGETASEPK